MIGAAGIARLSINSSRSSIDELRVLAASYMRHERAGHTLQTTALVGEAYMKLVNRSEATWQNRLHFFAVAASVMRHILVDYARARNTQRRGGAAQIPLDDTAAITDERALELVA